MYSDEDELGELIEEFDSSEESSRRNEQHANANADTHSKMKLVSEVLSLQQICLQSISDNLERFTVAVTTTKDIKVRMHLHYLRRVHTPFFLKNKLKENNGILKRKYWDFILNENLKEFHMSSIELKDWEDLLDKLDEVGHGFEKIDFDLCIPVELEKALVFVKKVLLKLPKIKRLHLHSYCDDTILEMLPSGCTELEELSLSKSHITDQGLKSLCEKKNNGDETHSLSLRVIHLPDITQMNDGVSYLLKNMPSLENIFYQELFYVLCCMYKHDMHKASEDKYNLTSFNIPFDLLSSYYPHIHNALLIISLCCPCIKVLSAPVKVKRDLECISNLPELEDFSAIDISPASDLDFDWFLKQKGVALKQLKLQNFNISVATLLGSCPNLESLSLRYTDFHLSNPSINLKQLHNLCELSIKASHLDGNGTPAVIEILNCSPKLKTLTLIDCELRHNEEFTSKFTKFCETSVMQYLEFDSCDVDLPFLQTILLTCSSLRALVLNLCYDLDSGDIETLYQISLSLKRKVEINWRDDRSEFNSYDSYGDIFDFNSESDLVDFDYYGSDEDDDEYFYLHGYDSDGF